MKTTIIVCDGGDGNSDCAQRPVAKITTRALAGVVETICSYDACPTHLGVLTELAWNERNEMVGAYRLQKPRKDGTWEFHSVTVTSAKDVD